MEGEPKTLQAAIQYFANPDNCLKTLVARRWPDGVIDPKDGPIIKTCLSCRANFLVTGDKQLLKLPTKRVKIVTATDFLNHLKLEGIS